MRGENPFTIQEVSAAMTPSDSRILPSLLPLNRRRIITSKVKMRVPQNHSRQRRL